MEGIEVDGVMVPHLIVPVGADGSCFFYSLSYLMYGTVSHATELRNNVVQHITNNWERFCLHTMLPCGNIYSSVAEYRAHMSLRTTFVTHCEIQAATEIYACHLVVYREGEVVLQPERYEEGRPVLRLKCSGDMMSAHFEPLIPQNFPALPPTQDYMPSKPDPPATVNLEPLPDQQFYSTDDELPLIHFVNPANPPSKDSCTLAPTNIGYSSSSLASYTNNLNSGKKRRKNKE